MFPVKDKIEWLASNKIKHFVLTNKLIEWKCSENRSADGLAK